MSTAKNIKSLKKEWQLWIFMRTTITMLDSSGHLLVSVTIGQTLPRTCLSCVGFISKISFFLHSLSYVEQPWAHFSFQMFTLYLWKFLQTLWHLFHLCILIDLSNMYKDTSYQLCQSYLWYFINNQYVDAIHTRLHVYYKMNYY